MVFIELCLIPSTCTGIHLKIFKNHYVYIVIMSNGSGIGTDYTLRLSRRNIALFARPYQFQATLTLN
jgi:hypothetical protein